MEKPTRGDVEFLFGPFATAEDLDKLIADGYKPYRKSLDNGKPVYTPCNINLHHLRANFNTQVEYGTGIFLRKGDEEYFFGLGPKDHPPRY